MRPEFPYEIPADVEIRRVEFDSPVECSMLRLGLPCRNDTHEGILFTLKDGSHIVVATCGICCFEDTRPTSDHTLFWRAWQKEWGVR